MNDLNAIFLYQKTFDESKELTDEIFKNFDFKNSLYEVYSNDKVASIAFIKEKFLNILGKKFSIPFLFGLATKNELKNKGFARDVLTKTIKDLNKKKRALLCLYPYPVDKSFYYKFSFSSFTYISKIPIKNLVISGTDIRENIPFKKAFNLYERVTKNFSIKQNFSSSFIKKRERIFKAFNAKTFGLYYNDYLYGYLSFDGEMVEESFFDGKFIEKNKDKILGDFLGEKLISPDLLVTNFLSKNSPFEPLSYTLIRPINYLSFLNMFKSNFDTKSNFLLKFLVRDEILGDIKLKIECKNNKIRFFEDFLGEDFISLTPNEFTEYILFSKTTYDLPKTNKTVFDYAFLDRY